jgi:predicted transcriptional regulator
MSSSVDTIPDAELKVLRTLWEKGSQTMRELTEAVYPGGGASDYATVQKLLERLLEKGLVVKDTDKWPYVFQAALSAQEVAARVAASAAARVIGLTGVAGLLAGPMGFVIGGAMAGASMARLLVHPKTDETKAETPAEAKADNPAAFVENPPDRRRKKDTVTRRKLD